MEFQGFHHVGVYIKDEEKSLRFYRDSLGGKLVHSFPIGEGRTNYLIDLGGGAIVELVPVGAGMADVQIGWAHIALRCADTRAAFELAVSVGAEVWMPPTEMNLGGIVMLLAYVYGPDHEIIEFYQEV
jgi:catechol 2,3-dioxygenase-like lactoylglutathione lyase family enzyme